MNDSWQVAYVYAFVRRFVSSADAPNAPHSVHEFEDALQRPLHVPLDASSSSVVPCLAPVLAVLVRDAQLTGDIPTAIAAFVRACLSSPHSSLSTAWQHTNRLAASDFDSLSWADRTHILRALVDHNLTYSDRVRDIIKQTSSSDPSSHTVDDFDSTLFYLRPIGYDSNKHSYWAIEDSPRLYKSGNPYKKNSEWKCVADSFPQILDLATKSLDQTSLTAKQRSANLITADPTKSAKKCAQLAADAGISRYVLEERFLRVRILSVVLPAIKEHMELRTQMVQRKRDAHIKRIKRQELKQAEIQRIQATGLLRSSRLRDRQAPVNYNEHQDDDDDGDGGADDYDHDNGGHNENQSNNTAAQHPAKRQRTGQHDKDYNDDKFDTDSVASSLNNNIKNEDTLSPSSLALSLGLRRSTRLNTHPTTNSSSAASSPPLTPNIESSQLPPAHTTDSEKFVQQHSNNNNHIPDSDILTSTSTSSSFLSSQPANNVNTPVQKQNETPTVPQSPSNREQQVNGISTLQSPSSPSSSSPSSSLSPLSSTSQPPPINESETKSKDQQPKQGEQKVPSQKMESFFGSSSTTTPATTLSALSASLPSVVSASASVITTTASLSASLPASASASSPIPAKTTSSTSSSLSASLPASSSLSPSSHIFSKITPVPKVSTPASKSSPKINSFDSPSPSPKKKKIPKIQQNKQNLQQPSPTSTSQINAQEGQGPARVIQRKRGRPPKNLQQQQQQQNGLVALVSPGNKTQTQTQTTPVSSSSLQQKHKLQNSHVPAQKDPNDAASPRKSNNENIQHDKNAKTIDKDRDEDEDRDGDRDRNETQQQNNNNINQKPKLVEKPISFFFASNF